MKHTLLIEILSNQQRILDSLSQLRSDVAAFKKTVIMDLTQLTADVAAETTIDQSVETLLTTLAGEITAAGGDPVALKALTDQMEANAAALGAAVTANTPAAPAS